MNDALKFKIKHLLIDENATLSQALKQMDTVDRKLLVVISSNLEYRSIISVGDIQRNLTRNQNFEAPVSSALRTNLRVAKTNSSKEEVRSEMLKYRMEFMPVLNFENELYDVIFWEEIFDDSHGIKKSNLNLPVVVMAGGQGTRLKPITNVIPKPLIPIGNKTIAEHIIERFMHHGCNSFYFTVNYKAEIIKNHFNSLKDKPYKIEYFQEFQPSGTAGSLSLLKDKIDTTFFVTNCDILVNQDLAEVLKYHKQNNNELSLIGAIKNIDIPYGTLKLSDGGFLEEITEKPEINYLVNAGLYIIEPHLLNEIPENEFFHITHLIENVIKRKGKVGVFPVSEASWMDIGNWTEYNETLKKLGETPFFNV